MCENASNKQTESSIVFAALDGLGARLWLQGLLPHCVRRRLWRQQLQRALVRDGRRDEGRWLCRDCCGRWQHVFAIRKGESDAGLNMAGEKVLSDGHRLFCEAVAVVAELVEVEAVRVCADRAAQEVCAVLCGAERCAEQLPVKPRTVYGADARGSLLVAAVCDVAADGGALRRVCVVDGARVDNQFDDAAVLPKVLCVAQHLHRAVCRCGRKWRVWAAAEKPQRNVRHVHKVPLHHANVRKPLPRLQLCRTHSRRRRCCCGCRRCSAAVLFRAFLCCRRRRKIRVVFGRVRRAALRTRPIQLVFDVVPAKPAHLRGTCAHKMSVLKFLKNNKAAAKLGSRSDKV